MVRAMWNEQIQDLIGYLYTQENPVTTYVISKEFGETPKKVQYYMNMFLGLGLVKRHKSSRGSAYSLVKPVYIIPLNGATVLSIGNKAVMLGCQYINKCPREDCFGPNCKKGVELREYALGLANELNTIFKLGLEKKIVCKEESTTPPSRKGLVPEVVPYRRLSPIPLLGSEANEKR